MARRGHRRHNERRRDNRYPARRVTLELSDPPSAEVRDFYRELFSSGWIRWLPPQSDLLLAAAYQNDTEPEDSFNSIAMDEEIWPPQPTDDHDDREYWFRQRRDARRFADHAGLALPGTRQELLALLEWYELIGTHPSGRLVMAEPLPLVTDSGVLSDDERAQEEALRWSAMYEPLAQRIIRIFVENQLDQWTGTVAALGSAIEVPAYDDVRFAVAELTSGVDFTCTPDPLTAGTSDELTIAVDWQAFDQDRIALR